MFVLLVSVKLAAQSDKVFHTYIYNDEFKLYMDICMKTTYLFQIKSFSERYRATSEPSATNVNG